MDKKYGIYALFIFLIELYLCVEILWLGVTLGVITIIAFIILQIRNRRRKEESLNNEIGRIHKSRHPDE